MAMDDDGTIWMVAMVLLRLWMWMATMDGDAEVRTIQ
jgi:hypothetical protein